METKFERRVPWYGVGHKIENGTDISSILTQAEVNYKVISAPVYSKSEDSFSVIPGVQSNVIEETGEVLGIVSNRYRIVQNEDAFKFIEGILDEVTFHSGGKFREGKGVWLQGEMKKEIAILGDVIKPHFLFTNSYDGTSPVKVAITPIRIACANAITLAVQKAVRVWKISHTLNVQRRIREVEAFFTNTEKYFTVLNETAEILQEKKLSNKKLLEAIDLLFPGENIKSSKAALRNLNERKEDVVNIMSAEDIHKFGNTGWAFINAVSDYETHRTPKKYSDTFEERRLEGFASGKATLIDRAFEVIKQIA